MTHSLHKDATLPAKMSSMLTGCGWRLDDSSKKSAFDGPAVHAVVIILPPRRLLVWFGGAPRQQKERRNKRFTFLREAWCDGCGWDALPTRGARERAQRRCVRRTVGRPRRHDLDCRRHVPHGVGQALSRRSAGSSRQRRWLLDRSDAGY